MEQFRNVLYKGNGMVDYTTMYSMHHVLKYHPTFTALFSTYIIPLLHHISYLILDTLCQISVILILLKCLLDVSFY